MSELTDIEKLSPERYREVASFLDDYASSISHIAPKIRKGGRVCFVVGNRTVKGVQIPLDYFTAEAFEGHGFVHRQTIVRSIPSKRMPLLTSPTNVAGQKLSTMNNEYIVILDKVS